MTVEQGEAVAAIKIRTSHRDWVFGLAAGERDALSFRRRATPEGTARHRPRPAS